MPAREPRDQVTEATRRPAASVERLTLSGVPMPRATSHSVWPSATEPPRAAGGALAPSDDALGSGAIPGHCPSALIRSSGVMGLSGVSGAVSIETFRMNSLPGRENQSASFDSMSLPKLAALEQPAISGAATASSSNRFGKRLCRTIFWLPTPPRRLSTTALRHQRGCLHAPQGETYDYH